MDGGAYQLDHCGDAQLSDKDFQVFLRCDRIRNRSVYHCWQAEGSENSQAVAEEEGCVGGHWDGATDRSGNLIGGCTGRDTFGLAGVRGRWCGCIIRSRGSVGGVVAVVTEQLGEFDIFPDANG